LVYEKVNILTKFYKTETDQYIVIDVSQEIFPPVKIRLNNVVIQLEK